MPVVIIDESSSPDVNNEELPITYYGPLVHNKNLYVDDSVTCTVTDPLADEMLKLSNEFCDNVMNKTGTVVDGTTAKGVKAGSAKGSDATSSGDTGGKLVHFDWPLAFTADDLLCATAEIMGKSTYGTVYKATLEDGSQVAVKRLRENIAKNQKEFETEVNAR